MKRSSTLNYCILNPGLNIEIKPSVRRKTKGFIKSIIDFVFNIVF